MTADSAKERARPVGRPASPTSPARPQRREAAFGIAVAVVAAGLLWLVVAIVYALLAR